MGQRIIKTDQWATAIPVVASRALVVTVDSTVSTATDITLNANTSFIRIFAKSQGLYVKGAATASSSSWDWFVPANQIVDIVKPDGVATISVIEETSGATAIIAEY